MAEAAVVEKEKTVAVMNLSKVGRRYSLKNGVVLVANQAVEVPASEAEFMLSVLPNGRARFPDLVDVAKMSPEAAKVKKDLMDENAKLLRENEALRAQLAPAPEPEKEVKRGKK